jgi:hypothetical protein
MLRHRRLLTHEGIFSPGYYEDGTSGNASNCHIISVGLYPIIYRSACLFLCIKLQLKFETYSWVCKRSFSLPVFSYGKIMTTQPASNYLSLFVWASCLSSFSNLPSVMDQKLNWNVTQALEKPFTICILWYTDSCCLVPFSSNLSWDSSQSLFVLTNKMRVL